jgi:hypothetical protein
MLVDFSSSRRLFFSVCDSPSSCFACADKGPDAEWVGFFVGIVNFGFFLGLGRISFGSGMAEEVVWLHVLDLIIARACRVGLDLIG